MMGTKVETERNTEERIRQRIEREEHVKMILVSQIGVQLLRVVYKAAAVNHLCAK
jgi:hypothetical protein